MFFPVTQFNMDTNRWDQGGPANDPGSPPCRGAPNNAEKWPEDHDILGECFFWAI